MRKKTLIVVNPISGVGRQKKIEEILNRHLNHDIFDYSIRYTEYIHHGTLIAHEAAMQGYDCVVAVGGDGTVYDIVQGLMGSDVRLGIIPCGSGNGLAHTLKLPLLPWMAARVLNQCYERTIDTIAVRTADKDNAPVHYSVNATGIGFDVHVARLMQSARSRGLSAYSNMVMRAYSNYRCNNYTLTINDQQIQRNAWIIAILNSNRIGYNLPVAPDAKLDDGMMDIDIIDKVPVEHLPISIPITLAGHISWSQHVEMFRASQMLIEGNVDRYADIDGECIEVGRNVLVTNIPNSLHIYGRAPIHEP